MGVDRCSPFDQEFGHLGMALVEHARASGPGLPSLIDVGARLEQYSNAFAIASLYRGKENRQLAVSGQRLVEFCFQFGMRIDYLLRPLSVLGAERG